jgi:hypothetical protein
MYMAKIDNQWQYYIHFIEGRNYPFLSPFPFFSSSLRGNPELCGAYAGYAPTLWASKVGPETEFTSAHDPYPLFFIRDREKR